MRGFLLIVGERNILDFHFPCLELQLPVRFRALGRLLDRANTRAAQASAFCSSVTTELISVKGFIYWLA
jgi:hypothetical protein